MIELKDCPFCGSFRKSPVLSGNKITCPDCGTFVEAKSTTLVVVKWNTRYDHRYDDLLRKLSMACGNPALLFGENETIDDALIKYVLALLTKLRNVDSDILEVWGSE